MTGFVPAANGEYSATVVLDGLTYATVSHPSRTVARKMAARATAEVLLREFREEYVDDQLPDDYALRVRR